MDTNGESCDGAGSEGDERDEEANNNNNNIHLTAANFVFIGANIKTGKSSIRSKQVVKKVRRAVYS